MNAARRLVAIDPSSTCTGYACWRGGDLIAFGKLMPARKSGPYVERIDSIVDQVDSLLNGFDPTHVVIETPSHHPGRGANAGATGRLAIYGVAVGAIRQIARMRAAHLSCPNEREWTMGRSQAKRVRLAGYTAPTYDPAQDEGADIADAICLGLWWIVENSLCRAVRESE